MYCPLFRFCFFMPVNTHKHKKAVIKNQCNLGTRMIKLENAGLRVPRKMSLGSGLHGQKRIRAPVSKMIGLRAPQQKFQGSRAPGIPPLGPWLFCDERHSVMTVTVSLAASAAPATRATFCSRRWCDLFKFCRRLQAVPFWLVEMVCS